MSFNSSQVDKLADLARLALTPAEREEYSREIAAILAYFDKLKQLDTADVPPLNQSIVLPNIYRADEVRDTAPEIQDCLIAGANNKSGRYIKVGKII